jgi:hypothetical protein
MSPSVLSRVAAAIEAHDVTRIRLGAIPTPLAELDRLRAAGLLRLEGGRVGLTPAGWRIVQETDRWIGPVETYTQTLPEARRVGLRVARALDDLAGRWVGSDEVARVAGVSRKSAREWLSRLWRDGQIHKQMGHRIPGDHAPNAYLWRSR